VNKPDSSWRFSPVLLTSPESPFLADGSHKWSLRRDQGSKTRTKCSSQRLHAPGPTPTTRAACLQLSVALTPQTPQVDDANRSAAAVGWSAARWHAATAALRRAVPDVGPGGWLTSHCGASSRSRGCLYQPGGPLPFPKLTTAIKSAEPCATNAAALLVGPPGRGWACGWRRRRRLASWLTWDSDIQKHQ
jgi:hypothetical protein